MPSMAALPFSLRHRASPLLPFGMTTSSTFCLDSHRQRTRMTDLYTMRRKRILIFIIEASDRNTVDAQVNITAKAAVNSGLELFSRGRVKDALAQFDAAITMNPDAEVALAAYYNKACCHACREEGEKAGQALRTALRDYNLKFSVVLNDPDMAPFRATPEFKILQDEARKGGEDIGQGFRRDLKLISEVQAPFRGIRKFFYVAFTMAAGISTVFTIPRLVLALRGGEDTPDVVETSKNLGINLAGVVSFVALYLWDTKKEEEQISRITRDETLSRLPVRISSNGIMELAQLRAIRRPVILAGKQEAVLKCLQKAEKYRQELLKRGVILVPIYWTNEKEKPPRKRGFANSRKLASATEVDFEQRARDVASKAIIEAERRFQAEAVSQVEWERWIYEQQESEGLTPGEEVYVVLRLDGRVRKSGRGLPDWQEIVKELPPLDAFVSRIER